MIALSSILAQAAPEPSGVGPYSIIAYVAIAVCVVWFTLVARRDLWMLLYQGTSLWKRIVAWVIFAVAQAICLFLVGFNLWYGRPTIHVVLIMAAITLAAPPLLMAVTLGLLGSAGAGRVWAVARTAIAEAWWAKAWAVPLLWLVACIIITSLVRPFDPRERMGLYLNVLLGAQQLMVLILVGVLACFSFPRERDRRTITTTGAKPVSRLELFLGKVVGFATVGAILLGLMGVLTFGYAWMTDYRIRAEAGEEYQKAASDFAKRIPGVGPPAEGLKEVSREGVLRAENLVTARDPRGMQVAGFVDYSQDPPVRYLKGGSSERVIYRFPSLYAAAGQKPFFYFQFPTLTERDPATGQAKPFPKAIEVRVTVSRLYSVTQGSVIEETIQLAQHPSYLGVFAQSWRPDPARLPEVIGMPERTGEPAPDRGIVEVTVQCQTNGVYLQVGEQSADANVLAINVDPARHGGLNMPPFPNPRMYGFEKRDLQQVEGPKVGPDASALLETASWRFKGADINSIPIGSDGKFTVSMLLDLEKTANNAQSTIARVMAYNQLDPRKRHIEDIPVSEKQITQLRIPKSVLAVNPTTGKVDADLFIDIQCLTPGHWIGANWRSVRLEQPPSFFAVNLFKSELVILCQVVLLVTIAVAASIRLGGPVAMLVTGVSYLLGNVFPFIQEQVASGGDSLFTIADQRDLAGSLLYKTANVLQAASLKLVYLFTHLLPNFTQFDAQSYIAEARNLPWWMIGQDVLWVGLYALPFVALAYLLIRKQELA